MALLFLISASAFKASNDYFEISKNLDIFSAVYKEIHTSYVDDTKPGELIRSAIDAMLKSLDPYTNFYSEAQAEDYFMQVTGAYGGLGASVRKRADKIMIDEVFGGFAAEKADLRPGDFILEVDGNSTEGKTAEEVTKLLKGQADTEVSLTIERPGIGQLSKMVNREKIKIKNVPYFGMVQDGVGYIQLTGFTPDAGKEVYRALQDLKLENNVQAVILDLRDNGGGLLHEAVNIVNVFVKKGQLIVTTRGKNKEEEKTYQTLNAPLDTDIPVAVLINGRSASASEIVSGSIQDLDRGVVIGSKSFGKGLVQQSRNLTYGTQMKITVAKYYIPSGRCIQKLDYGHKENGRAVEVPDSIKKTFYSLYARRPFIDGDGVSPDIPIKRPERSKIAQALIDNYVIFDYATNYRNEHDSIVSPKSFSLGDTDFEHFVSYLKKQDLSYTTDTEKALVKLREKAEEESYFNGISSQIESLNTALASNKEEDVQRHKEEILEMLETEIARRYYHQQAEVETSFEDDKDILKAIEILLDKEKYRSILAGQA
jgi:carboxyl-terminal processing protease